MLVLPFAALALVSLVSAGDTRSRNLNLARQSPGSIPGSTQAYPAINGTCNPGDTLCDDTRCMDLKTNSHHCGACYTQCGPAGFGRCEDGYCPHNDPNACPPGWRGCENWAANPPLPFTCVDHQNDRNHCGSCLVKCPDDWTCSGGKCQPQPQEPEPEPEPTTCPQGLTSCGGGCVNAQNDNNNCGTCGKQVRR
jgi:hypothetical protein